jgi:hypothetical protein
MVTLMSVLVLINHAVFIAYSDGRGSLFRVLAGELDVSASILSKAVIFPLVVTSRRDPPRAVSNVQRGSFPRVNFSET